MERERQEAADRELKAKQEAAKAAELKEKKRLADEAAKAAAAKAKADADAKIKKEREEKERQLRLAQLEEESKKSGPLDPPSDDYSDEFADAPSGGVINVKSSQEVTAKKAEDPKKAEAPTSVRSPIVTKQTHKTSSYEEYTESAEPEAKEEPKKSIDPEVWREARGSLSDLLRNFGQNKYQSNNCTIKSLFDHPKDKVNAGKPKVMKDMKEELSDTIQEVLMQLNITAKVIEFSPYQQQ